MPIIPPIRARKTSEDGFMLLAAIFMLFLLAISLTIAAPLIARSIQRDREVETMERGKQYTRAIQLYFRKFGSYPPSIDALVKTSNLRFLRKRYIDPMTGKDDWKPILFGQNKAPLAMGFFGEPLAGGATALAGTGPSGNNNATPGAGFGAPASGLTGTGNLLGSGQNTGAGSGATSGTTTGGTAAGGTQTGTTGTSASGTPAPGTGTTGTGVSTLGGTTGQTFGGAGIVGFEPAPARQSILMYKKKNHYNEWEFTYSPISDQMKQIGNTGTVGQPASSLGGSPGTGFPSSSGPGATPISGGPTGSPIQPR